MPLGNPSLLVQWTAGSGVRRFVRPGEAYMPTKRLKSLFKGVPGVLFMDESRECLKGGQICNLLRAARISECLVRVQVQFGSIGVEDYKIMGLDALLQLLGNLPNNEAAIRARILWKALLDVRKDKSQWEFNNWFDGCRSWFYYKKRYEWFPAEFTKTLNKVAWVARYERQAEATRLSGL